MSGPILRPYYLSIRPPFQAISSLRKWVDASLIVIDSVLGAKPLPSYLQPFLPMAATRSPAGALGVAIGLLLVVAGLSQLQALANKVVRKYVGEGLVLSFRATLVEQAQRLSLSYHDSTGTADSLYRIQQDAAAIENIMVEGVVPFIAAGFTPFR